MTLGLCTYPCGVRSRGGGLRGTPFPTVGPGVGALARCFRLGGREWLLVAQSRELGGDLSVSLKEEVSLAEKFPKRSAWGWKQERQPAPPWPVGTSSWAARRPGRSPPPPRGEGGDAAGGPACVGVLGEGPGTVPGCPRPGSPEAGPERTGLPGLPWALRPGHQPPRPRLRQGDPGHPHEAVGRPPARDSAVWLLARTLAAPAAWTHPWGGRRGARGVAAGARDGLVMSVGPGGVMRGHSCPPPRGPSVVSLGACRSTPPGGLPPPLRPPGQRSSRRGPARSAPLVPRGGGGFVPRTGGAGPGAHLPREQRLATLQPPWAGPLC